MTDSHRPWLIFPYHKTWPRKSVHCRLPLSSPPPLSPTVPRFTAQRNIASRPTGPHHEKSPKSLDSSRFLTLPFNLKQTKVRTGGGWEERLLPGRRGVAHRVEGRLACRYVTNPRASNLSTNQCLEQKNTFGGKVPLTRGRRRLMMKLPSPPSSGGGLEGRRGGKLFFLL